MLAETVHPQGQRCPTWAATTAAAAAPRCGKARPASAAMRTRIMLLLRHRSCAAPWSGTPAPDGGSGGSRNVSGSRISGPLHRGITERSAGSRRRCRRRRCWPYHGIRTCSCQPSLLWRGRSHLHPLRRRRRRMLHAIWSGKKYLKHQSARRCRRHRARPGWTAMPLSAFRPGLLLLDSYTNAWQRRRAVTRRCSKATAGLCANL